MPKADAEIVRSARILFDYHRLDQPVGPCDVIIGLGSYDLRVAERSAELFRAGIAPVIIFTGHSGHWTEGRYEVSEAATFAARAAEMGVPASAVSLEENARNIGENLAFTAPMVARDARVVLVTKPQTQRRCYASVMRQWPDALGERLCVTAPPTRFEDQPTPEFPLPHLIDEMVGDLWRILEYPKLGFQIEQDVPGHVLAAYETLIGRGYDRHIPV